MKLRYRKQIRLFLVIAFLATSLIASQVGTSQSHPLAVVCLAILVAEVAAIGLIS